MLENWKKYNYRYFGGGKHATKKIVINCLISISGKASNSDRNKVNARQNL